MSERVQRLAEQLRQLSRTATADIDDSVVIALGLMDFYTADEIAEALDRARPQGEV